MTPSKKIIVIGSGFAGLSAACYLARQNFEVTVLEKNSTPGGRARLLQVQGFTFDMGPSWYWMPDVFENFFKDFGRDVSEFYKLIRLDPSYKVFFDQQEVEVPADFDALQQLFEQIEPGSSSQLESFLKQAKRKYQVGMNNFALKTAQSWTEFLDLGTARNIFHLDLFQPFDRHLTKFFKDQRLIQLLTFPILFLGATPKETPALYSLMNFADIKLGTWYPTGGMYELVNSMVRLAKSLGVRFIYNQEVKRINIDAGVATGVITSSKEYISDLVVASADYHHIETACLPPAYQSYSQKYWESRTLSPSSIIYYLGLSKKINGLRHHNLFFDANLSTHMDEIYEKPVWPSDPLFYVSAVSKSDPSVCPPGHENLFVLIPAAAGLNDTDDIRSYYYELVIDRLEKNLGVGIRDAVVYKKSYTHRNFIRDYHAFKGNAYGLANTLSQTAFLKPKIKSKHIPNLYYAGQLTVPGPGVPPSLISGKIVANQIIKEMGHEEVV